MASPTLRRIHFTLLACTAGAYSSYVALAWLSSMLQPAADSGRLVLLVLSTIIGGAAAAFLSPSLKTFPCLVISVLTTFQLYDPIFLGPDAIKPWPVYLATVIAGFVASYFGHTFTASRAAGTGGSTASLGRERHEDRHA